MGNHAVGQAMDRAAQEAVRSRRPKESALEILDRICAPYRGADAEFESTDPDNPSCVHPEFDDCREPHPKAALGMLLLEAFAPNGVADLQRYAAGFDERDDENALDAWWSEVRDPFAKRYDFC